MKRRNVLKHTLLVLVSIFSFMAFSEVACALGFGQLKLHSYLNEPLDAEIELLGYDEVDLNNTVAALASTSDFKKIKLARPYFLTKLTFEIMQQDERVFILVTSKEAVKEPFLDFLVVLNWPEGRLVRGYTILLDPAPIGSPPRRTRSTLNEIQQSKPEEAPDPEDIAVSIKNEFPATSPKEEEAEPEVGTRIEAPAGATLQDSKYPTEMPSAPPAGAASTTPVDIHEGHDDNESPELHELHGIPQGAYPTSGLQKTQRVAQKGIPKVTQSTTAQKMENLFEPEQKPKLKRRPPKVAKTDPKQVVQSYFAQKAAEVKPVPPVVVTEVENPKQNWVLQLQNNRMLLGTSGLALLLGIATSIWFLKRARQTLSVPRTVEKMATAKADATFDEEFEIRLDLARQYAKVDDQTSAKEILQEIISYGNKKERKSARQLLEDILAAK